MSTTAPKARGCFQCSKRRIICDGTRPSCRKCHTKGIDCSGPGRFRFSTGVAQRGKLKGCRIPVANEEVEAAFTKMHSTSPGPQKIRWTNDRKLGKRVTRPATSALKRRRRVSPVPEDSCQLEIGETYDVLEINTTAPGAKDCCTEWLSFGELMDESDELEPASAFSDLGGPVGAWIAPLDAVSRMYFSLFAEEIAPVMVVFDELSNGYRDILLPMACRDGLLMWAINSVTAQYLALRQPGFQSAVAADRAALISRLRRDSMERSPDCVFDIPTWSTLIVLLVGETITGSPEYNYLLQTLLYLSQDIKQVPSAVTEFLLQQTHMFQFLGQPLLGEVQGLDALRLPIDYYLDWMYYDYLPEGSEYTRILHVSRLAFIKASEIYIGRATSNQNQWESLENLKQLVSQVDTDKPGAHALVWVFFIAAADSADLEHRRYFTDRMKGIFARTRFRNITTALESLPAIWSQQGTKRWTEHAFRLIPTLVM